MLIEKSNQRRPAEDESSDPAFGCERIRNSVETAVMAVGEEFNLLGDLFYM